MQKTTWRSYPGPSRIKRSLEPRSDCAFEELDEASCLGLIAELGNIRPFLSHYIRYCCRLKATIVNILGKVRGHYLRFVVGVRNISYVDERGVLVRICD